MRQQGEASFSFSFSYFLFQFCICRSVSDPEATGLRDRAHFLCHYRVLSFFLIQIFFHLQQMCATCFHRVRLARDWLRDTSRHDKPLTPPVRLSTPPETFLPRPDRFPFLFPLFFSWCFRVNLHSRNLNPLHASDSHHTFQTIQTNPILQTGKNGKRKIVKNWETLRFPERAF